jgi:beta-apo-4'-carotenal oxygenase
MAVHLPAFANTPVDQIPKIVEEVRSTFFTQTTKPLEFRLRQLRKLYWGLVERLFR